MKVLKLKLHQKSANYNVGGSYENRMTYPAPPLSSVIGMLHHACDWDNYHDMKLSIHCHYESLNRNLTRSHSVMAISAGTERGILTETAVPGVFTPFAVNRIGNFDSGKTVFDEEGLQQFVTDKENRDVAVEASKEMFTQKEAQLKAEKEAMKSIQKTQKKKSDEYIATAAKIKQIDDEKKSLPNERTAAKEQILQNFSSRYKNISTYVCEVETLFDINLVIYVSASDEDLEEIRNNAYNIFYLGRSEDMVKVISCEYVELEEISDEVEQNQEFGTWVDCSIVASKDVFLNHTSQESSQIRGTVYRIPKNYTIVDGLRVFEKKKVMYLNHFAADDVIPDVYVDMTEECPLIVNLL